MGMGVEEDATARKRFLGSWRTGGGGGWGSPPSPKMLLRGIGQFNAGGGLEIGDICGSNV